VDILLILLGAALAIGGEILMERWRDTRRRRVLALALEEELRAVYFDDHGFGGYTAQTFDEFFPEIAALLPPNLAREVIRYHFRMNHFKAVGGEVPPSVTELREMAGIRNDLVRQLQRISGSAA